MTGVGASGTAARRAPIQLRDAWLPALAIGCGALIAALQSYGTAVQAAITLGLGLGFLLLILFLVRPHTAIAGYLLLLPLMLAVPVAAGLNAGEALTLVFMMVAILGLWEPRDRVAPALRALSPILWPLLALTAVSIVSLLVNGIFSFEEVVSSVVKIVAFGLLSVLVHVHTNTPAKARTLLVGLITGGFFVAAYSIVAYVLGWSYMEEFDLNRATGTFENSNQLGAFLALLAPATLGFAAVSGRSPARLLLAVTFVLLIVALLLTLTLGSMVGLLFGGFVALVFLGRMNSRRIVPGLLLAMIGFAIVFATVPTLRDKLTRFDERFLDRIRTYAVGVSMFRDKFWFGFGSEQNLVDQLYFGEADYGVTEFGLTSVVPHNSFLKIGAEKGVFGVIVLTLLVVGALRVLLRHRRELATSRYALLHVGVFAGVLAFLVQNMTNDIMLHARLGIIFFALIAIMDQLGRAASGNAPAAIERDPAAVTRP